MRLSTTDLYESTWLWSQGVPPREMKVDRSRKQRSIVFVFDATEEIARLQETFHSGQATVNLAEFREKLETLKERMFKLLQADKKTGVGHDEH